MTCIHNRYEIAALGLVMALGIGPTTLRAQDHGDCLTPIAEKYLNANNVSARILNNGGLFWRGEPSEYRVPRFGEPQALWIASILIAGLIDDELHAAAARVGRWEYWSGPLDDDGNPPVDCSPYDRLYSIRLDEIEEYEQTGTPSLDLFEWPTGLGAPTIDSNGKIVDLTSLPFLERSLRKIDLEAGERPAMHGDQMIWWIMNDRGNEHLSTQSPPIGLEVHGLAFATSSSVESVNNSTFYKYRIINNNALALSETYFGIHITDPFLGDGDDNYVGSDSTLGIAFVYNGDNDDLSRSGYGYGTPPPAVGIQFIKGPDSASDGIDNDKDGLTDEAGEMLQMTNFMYYNGGGGVTEDPTTGDHYYGYLRSLWKDGKPMTFGGTGRDFSERPAKFFYPGDPVTRQYWSEINSDSLGTPISPGYRRFIMGMGPFDLGPGEETEVVFSIVWAKGLDHLDSVTELRKAALEVKQAFETEFAGLPEGITPTTVVDLNAPADNALSQPRNPTVFWTPTSDAEGYRIEVTSLKSTREYVEQESHLALDNLDSNQFYTWRVRAENSFGAGPWSERRNFFTGETAFGYAVEYLLVVQNAGGRLDPPDLGSFAINNSGFPSLSCPTAPQSTCDLPTRGYQQITTNAVWGIQQFSTRSFGFDSFVRALHDNNRFTLEETVGFNDYEWRFTTRCTNSPSECLAWESVQYDRLMQVPFELWNVGTDDNPDDDYRMIPFVWDRFFHGEEGFDIARDHAISAGDDDPFTDEVNWYDPADTIPGESGYRSFFSAPSEDSPSLGGKIISRTVLVQLDAEGGPPYSVTMPEPGTIFKIVTRKPAPAILASPGHESEIIPGSVSFYWNGNGLQRLQVFNTAASTPIIDEPDLTAPFSIEIREAGDYTWRVQSESGMWSESWKFTVCENSDCEPFIPSDFSLSNNYPNPFSRSSTITYSLPFSTRVKIDVYDLLGRRVQTLLNGKMPAGEHQIRIDGLTFAPGVYFYSLSAGEFKETRKMVVLK